jgi:hypothetical protein
MRANNASRALLLLLATACSNAGTDAIFPQLYHGSLNVDFYLDRDGNGTRSTGDPAIPGVRVALFSAGGSDTVQVLVSDADGKIQFKELPFGTYHFAVVHATIGDSLTIVTADTSKVRILARLDSLTDLRDIGLRYPELTIAQARSALPGRRVMIRGKVLAPYQTYLDPQGYVSDATGAIRVTNASQLAGKTASVTGDSVLVVGTTGTDLGQAVLLNGIFSTLGTSSTPVARVITVAQARTALGGTLDAAFVQVGGALISDTTNVLPNYRVNIVDALISTDHVDVLFDQLVAIIHSAFRPGAAIVVRGVLKPKGDGTWMIMPRAAADVTFP